MQDFVGFSSITLFLLCKIVLIRDYCLLSHAQCMDDDQVILVTQKQLQQLWWMGG